MSDNSSDRRIIDPTKPFFMAAQVTQAGRPDLIDFTTEVPQMAIDEETLIAGCRADAREFGGRYYIFEVRPVRRFTRKTMKLVG